MARRNEIHQLKSQTMNNQFADQTILGTPIPLVSSTIEKKSYSPERDIDDLRLQRLTYLKSRSWINNFATPKTSLKPSPEVRRDSGNASSVSERRSSESFKSILNLQTMDDLSGSMLDVQISEIPTSHNERSELFSRIPESKVVNESDKENSSMPVVGLSPGHSNPRKEFCPVIPESVTLNWEEITRPPSPTPRESSNVFDFPSRLLQRKSVEKPFDEFESNFGGRLESILASDNSDLSDSRGKSPSCDKDSFQFTMNRNFSGIATNEHNQIDIGSGFSSTGNFIDHLDAKEIEADSSILSAEEEIRENMVTPSSSWFQNNDSSMKNQMKSERLSEYIRDRCETKSSFSGVGLSFNSPEQTKLSPTPFTTQAGNRHEIMPSIEEEEDILDVTLTDKEEADDPANVTMNTENRNTLSISLLQQDENVSGQNREEDGHPLASSTSVSLTTSSSTSSEENSSLANLSDIRNALQNELWESCGPAGIASFVQHQVKLQKEIKSKPTSRVSSEPGRSTPTGSTDAETIRAATTASSSLTSPEKWTPLQESFKIPPMEVCPANVNLIDLKTFSRTVGVESVGQMTSSFASSQATTVRRNCRVGELAGDLDTNNSNTDKVEENGDRPLGSLKRRERSGDTRRSSRSANVDQILFPFDIIFKDSAYIGSQLEQSFAITNRSKRLINCSIDISFCACDSVTLSDKEASKTFLVRPTVVIGPDISRAITMCFKPTRPGHYSGEMMIRCNGHNSGIPMIVNLSASAEEPRLKVRSSNGERFGKDGHLVNFGAMQWNTSQTRNLVFMNEGGRDLPLSLSLSPASSASEQAFCVKPSASRTMSTRHTDFIVPRQGHVGIDVSCSPSDAHCESESTNLLSTCHVDLQGSTKDASGASLLTFKLEAQVGHVQLVIPKPYSMVRLDSSRERCQIPIKNIGSISASVRVVLDSPMNAEWLSLRLDNTDRKLTIAPDTKEYVTVSYSVHRNFSPMGEVSATLFIIGDPKGPVYEIPIVCEPSFDQNENGNYTDFTSSSTKSLSAVRSRPPIIASKSIMLWAGVNDGNGEKQSVVLKNTTSVGFDVNLSIENVSKGGNSMLEYMPDAFLLRDPMSGSKCRNLRVNLEASSNTPITIMFRPPLPRYFRARLLIRATSHKTTFVIGLRGYGGKGALRCANSESPVSSQKGETCVKLLTSKSLQHQLVLYNSGGRTILVNTKATGGAVVPSNFFVPPSAAKTVSFIMDKIPRINFEEEKKVKFVYTDAILRHCFPLIDDGGAVHEEEEMPMEDRSLQWSRVYGSPPSLRLRFIPAVDETATEETSAVGTVEGPTTSFRHSSADSPLRETMMRVGDFEDSLAVGPISSMEEEKCHPSNSVLRSKPHVEEWLRRQQVLSSMAPSSVSRGFPLVKILTPMEIDFLGLDGYQERTMELMNVSGGPVRWSLTADGPLICDNKSCGVVDEQFNERCLPWSPFSFSPSSSQRLESAEVERVRVRCGFRQDGRLPSTFLRKHASCRRGFHQRWTLSSLVSDCIDADNDSDTGSLHENLTLLLRVQQSPNVANQTLPSLAKCRFTNPNPSLSSASSPAKSRLLIKQREVLFPLIRVHGQQVERLKITNRSKNQLAVLFRALPEPFRLDLRAPSQMVLKPEHCVMLPLVFRPTEPGRFQALLTVECAEEVDEPAQQILLIGEATP